jgi:hypothetical protein
MLEKYFNTDILKSNKMIDNLIKKYKYVDNIDKKILNQENQYNLDKEELDNIDLGYYTSNYKNKLCLEILTKELNIIKLLSKYSLQTNELDFIFIVKSLKLCLELSEILRLKLNQKEKVIPDNVSIIQRCSYKFCNFKDNCNYNYLSKNNYCYQDHYVHNMVSHDLMVLIKYIENNTNCLNKKDYLKEILKSINTLSYVINHMENELKAKCLYQNKEDWDSFHIINTYN